MINEHDNSKSPIGGIVIATATIAVFWALVLYLLVSLSGCSVHFGVDWHGESGVDNRTSTQLTKKSDKY